MVATTSILPSYQRFVNGVPVPLFSRRAFRPREKYLILLVFLTFGVVCFGAFFFLPDFRGGTGGAAVNSVYRVYKRIQKVGPELLIPAPPHANLGPMDPHGPGAAAQHNALGPGLGHDDEDENQDVHLIADKQKLQAKINEEYQQQKTLERPEVAGGESRVRTSSASSLNAGGERRGQEELLQTVPPAPADTLPKTVGGEDKDPIARERRDKVKELPRPSAKCGKVASYSLSINEIQQLLQAYNSHHYKGQKQVQWDEELAKSAQAWANQCTHKVDECRNVERFKVKQSFSYVKSAGDFTSDISKLVIKSDMPKGTTLIGCGAVRYNSDRKHNTTFLVCNYANGGEY